MEKSRIMIIFFIILIVSVYTCNKIVKTKYENMNKVNANYYHLNSISDSILMHDFDYCSKSPFLTASYFEEDKEKNHNFYYMFPFIKIGDYFIIKFDPIESVFFSYDNNILSNEIYGIDIKTKSKIIDKYFYLLVCVSNKQVVEQITTPSERILLNTKLTLNEILRFTPDEIINNKIQIIDSIKSIVL